MKIRTFILQMAFCLGILLSPSLLSASSLISLAKADSHAVIVHSGTFDTIRSSIDTTIIVYPCPDSAQILFIPYYGDRRIGFGISTGVSATQVFSGEVVFGVYVGFGFQFNIIEF